MISPVEPAAASVEAEAPHDDRAAAAASNTSDLLHRFRPGESLDDEIAAYERSQAEVEAEPRREVPATLAMAAEPVAEPEPELVGDRARAEPEPVSASRRSRSPSRSRLSRSQSRWRSRRSRSPSRSRLSRSPSRSSPHPSPSRSRPSRSPSPWSRSPSPSPPSLYRSRLSPSPSPSPSRRRGGAGAGRGSARARARCRWARAGAGRGRAATRGPSPAADVAHRGSGDTPRGRDAGGRAAMARAAAVAGVELQPRPSLPRPSGSGVRWHRCAVGRVGPCCRRRRCGVSRRAEGGRRGPALRQLRAVALGERAVLPTLRYTPGLNDPAGRTVTRRDRPGRVLHWHPGRDPRRHRRPAPAPTPLRSGAPGR